MKRIKVYLQHVVSIRPDREQPGLRAHISKIRTVEAIGELFNYN